MTQKTARQGVKKMKFALNYNKWRCGASSSPENSHGEGKTRLLNSEGDMCCLGQIMEQEGFLIDQLYDFCHPISLVHRRDKKSFLVDDGENTRLAVKAMVINDNPHTKISQKIAKLQELFAADNIELEFANFPQWVKDEQPELEYV